MGTERSHSILLVEDEPINVLLIRRAISKLKHAIQLKVVGNGEEAVKFLREIRAAQMPDFLPDLVLTDIKMPRMTGIELLSWIKQQPDLMTLPVVILSSSEDPEDVNQAKQLGANSYFVRPGSAQEMVELMRQIVTSLTSTPYSLCGFPIP